MSTFQYACIYFYKHIPNIYYYYITIPLKTKRHMGTENDNVSIAAAQKSDMISSQKHDILKLTTSTTTTTTLKKSSKQHKNTDGKALGFKS